MRKNRIETKRQRTLRRTLEGMCCAAGCLFLAAFAAAAAICAAFPDCECRAIFRDWGVL